MEGWKPLPYPATSSPATLLYKRTKQTGSVPLLGSGQGEVLEGLKLLVLCFPICDNCGKYTVFILCFSSHLGHSKPFTSSNGERNCQSQHWEQCLEYVEKIRKFWTAQNRAPSSVTVPQGIQAVLQPI